MSSSTPVRYRKDDSTVARLIGRELVVIQVQTSVLYHFSPSMKPFFDLFSEGATLEQVTESLGIGGAPERVAELNRFVAWLLSERLLTDSRDCSTAKDRLPKLPPDFEWPQLLKEDRRSFEELMQVAANA